ncbi:hypothetical protein [Azospirillum melinis]
MAPMFTMTSCPGIGGLPFNGAVLIQNSLYRGEGPNHG